MRRNLKGSGAPSRRDLGRFELLETIEFDALRLLSAAAFSMTEHDTPGFTIASTKGARRVSNQRGSFAGQT